MIGPSLVAGAVLCWARALGEFGATITFAGNLQGRTQTMPLAVFLALETTATRPSPCRLVLVAVSLVVLVALRDRWFTAIDDARSPSLRVQRAARHARPRRRPRRGRRRDRRRRSVPTAPARPRCSAPSPACVPIDAGRIDLDGQVLDDPAAGVFVDRPTAGRSASCSRTTCCSHTDRPRQRRLRAPGAGRRARPSPGRGPGARADRPRPPRAARGRGPVGRAGRSGSRWPGRWPPSPRLLLLDEPLAALDASARVAVRCELRRQLAEFAGRPAARHPRPARRHRPRRPPDRARGGPRHPRRHRPPRSAPGPASSYVAELVGLNLWHGTADDTRRSGWTLAATSPSPTASGRRRHRHRPAPGRRRAPTAPHGSPRNVWPATVATIEAEATACGSGSSVRCRPPPRSPPPPSPSSSSTGRRGLGRGQGVDVTAYPR